MQSAVGCGHLTAGNVGADGGGRALFADSPPADALFTWLRAFITHVATKRDLPLAIPDDTTRQRSALYQQWHATMRARPSRWRLHIRSFCSLRHRSWVRGDRRMAVRG